MANVTLLPNGDGTRTNWTDQASGTSNLYQNVDAGTGSPSDSDYITTSSTTNSMFLLLQDTPFDFSDATAVDISVRARRVGAPPDPRTVTFQIFQSDEATAITNAVASSSLTTSFANYTVTLSITGATGKSAWDGARLRIERTGSNGQADVSEVQADVTYTTGLAEYDLVASPAAFTLTGRATNAQRTFVASKGTFTLTGVAANLERSKKLTAENGTFTLTAIAATPLATRKLTALPAVFQLDGESAAFIAGLYQLDGDTATFALTGVAATPKYNRVTTASVGEFTLTGKDAPSNYKIPSDTATFTFTANASDLGPSIGFVCASGSFTLTGVAAGMQATRRMTASKADFTLTVRPVAFPPRYRVLLALKAAFTLTGGTVPNRGQIVANPGSFAMSGIAAGMTYTQLSGRGFGQRQSRIFRSRSISMKG